MTTVAVSRSRRHLDDNRRLIASRAVAAAVFGGVPIPGLDEWMESALMRRTYRQIADSRHVDIQEDALRDLVHGPRVPNSLAQTVASAVVLRALRRRWRRVLVGLLLAQRSRTLTRHFTRATLFDHYCARLHVGPGIDRPTALALHESFRRAMERAPGGLGQHAFKDAIAQIARAGARAPIELANLISGGAVRALLDRGSDREIVAEIETAMDSEVRAESSALVRAVRVLEQYLAVGGNPYLEGVVDSFEQMWMRRPTSTPPEDA